MSRTLMYGNLSTGRAEPLSVTITVRGEGKQPWTMRVPMCTRVSYEIQRDYISGVTSTRRISPLELAGRLDSFRLDVAYPAAIGIKVGDDPDAENMRLHKALEAIRGLETDPEAPQFLPGLAMAALEGRWPNAT